MSKNDEIELTHKPAQSTIESAQTDTREQLSPAQTNVKLDAAAATAEIVEKDQKGLVKATLSWRHAAANAIAFSFAMLISFVLQFTAVLLLVSEQWIRDNHWEVELALQRFSWLLRFSLFLCPLVFCINLLLRRDEEPVKKMMLRMELIGALSSLLLGALYYWPGYLR